jgi:hypothetical protein
MMIYAPTSRSKSRDAAKMATTALLALRYRCTCR